VKHLPSPPSQRSPKIRGHDDDHEEKLDDVPIVVFTTAYDSYAVRAFETSAIDYLVKPIASERLAASLARGRFGDRVAWFKDPMEVSLSRVTLNPGMWY
jgi:DNA-binding LytR/AlgR family response regulator